MKKKIIDCIRGKCALKEKKISLKTKLIDLSLDSISFISLLVELENQFDFLFTDDELSFYKYKVVNDLVILVEDKLKNGNQRNRAV